MLDRYGRIIDYLRISLTDRCNFRCSYCMPQEGLQVLDSSEFLSYEELLRIIKVLGQYGIDKVRLTGGEPLIRHGIVDFIRGINSLGTIRDIALTTNGSLLGTMAKELKAAGLRRVNISLDTIDPARFHRITGRDELHRVLAGLKQASAAGFHHVKLNVVLTEEVGEADLDFFIAEVQQNPVAVRFIEYMPIGRQPLEAGTGLIQSVKERIQVRTGDVLQPCFPVGGSGPARYYRLSQSQGWFGFITPRSEHFCQQCNRIRLTADGKIKPCLLSNTEFDIKKALRSHCSDQEIYEHFARAVWAKSAQHRMGYDQPAGEIHRAMVTVGG